MQQEVALILTMLPTFTFVLLRVSSFLFAAPFFSNRAIPARVRATFALLITLVVLPFVPEVPAYHMFSVQTLMVVFQQILIGLAVGFMLRIVFEIVLLSGQIISYQTGLGFATLVNPLSNVTVPMISQVYLLSITLVFILLNGHLMLIEYVAKSFHTMPIGVNSFGVMQIGAVLDFTKVLFADATLIALPAIIAILIVNFTFGILTSTAPQLNIFNIGFPITLVMGLFIVYLSFSSVMGHAHELVNDGLLSIKSILQVK